MGLKVENVSKHFGSKLAVDNISFEINDPGVFGLLGTNGAGKSTTIRMILGILKKDSGNITWNGKPVERKNINFGYLPEERGIYPKTKIYEQLLFFSELKGMKKEDATKEIEKQNMKLIKQVDINYEIEIKDEDDAYTLMKNLVNNNYKINKFELKRPSLNDIFIEKVGQ